MKRVATALCMVLVVVGAVGAYWRFGRAAASSAATEAPRFAAAEMRALAATVLATGIIRLRVGAEVRVGSQASGIVNTLNVTVGSHIRQGEVIATIDSKVIEAQLAQARAQVAIAEQDVRQAAVALTRAERLDERQIVPKQQVEDLSLALDAAKARLEKARRDADVVETGLSYAVIRAPISGIVASVSTQEGETVAASFTAPTFVTIIADHALQLVAMVDETDIGAVAGGNAVTFTVEAYPGREHQGHVESIAPKATIVSGVVNYEVTIAIDSPADTLKPDMTANISIRTAERQALMIPNAAIQRDGDDRFVYVDQHGVLTKQPVTLGTRDAAMAEVKRGITVGDRILIASGPNALSKDVSR